MNCMIYFDEERNLVEGIFICLFDWCLSPCRSSTKLRLDNLRLSYLRTKQLGKT